MDEKLKKINLRQSDDKVLTINPASIPDLVPKKILKEWMEGDEDPYFKIQEIEFPLIANGYNYTEKFFKSFIKKLKRAPIPGSNDGHEMSWGKRGKTDIILIGADLKSNGDGSGVVHFKNYFPLEGASGNNEVLIREAKSNMLEFSLVSYTKDEREEKPDGTVIYNVVESMFGERNDIVPYGEGAMMQKTNRLSGLNTETLYEDASETSDSYVLENPFPNEHSARMKDPGRFQEGSFRRISLPGSKVIAIIGRLEGETTTTIQAYRFPIDDFTEDEARSWLKENEIEFITFEPATGEKENKKGDDMDKKAEALQALKNFKANGEITLLDIAKALNLEALVITDAQKLNLSKYDSVKALCGETDPVDFVNGLIGEKKANAEAVRSAKLDQVFGIKEDSTTKKENIARTYAEKILGSDELTEEKINEIKSDSAFKTLASELADSDSDFNIIGQSEKKNATISKTGVKVRKI